MSNASAFQANITYFYVLVEYTYVRTCERERNSREFLAHAVAVVVVVVVVLVQIKGQTKVFSLHICCATAPAFAVD